MYEPDCKKCGKELSIVDDKMGKRLVFVCINPECSEHDVTVQII